MQGIISRSQLYKIIDARKTRIAESMSNTASRLRDASCGGGIPIVSSTYPYYSCPGRTNPQATKTVKLNERSFSAFSWVTGHSSLITREGQTITQGVNSHTDGDLDS